MIKGRHMFSEKQRKVLTETQREAIEECSHVAKYEALYLEAKENGSDVVVHDGHEYSIEKWAAGIEDDAIEACQAIRNVFSEE
jgi:hypothetical protein